MTARIHILSGACAGRVLTFSGDRISVGRDRHADLRFSPDGDLEVSSRHAVIRRDGVRWLVRDLGSRNGTYLNGQRISGDTHLRDGDRVQFGGSGPVVVFSATAQAEAISPTARIRAQVARQTRGLRLVALALATLLVASVIAFLHTGQRQRAAWNRERAELLERVDSLLSAGEQAARALQGEQEGLAAALQESQSRLEELRAELDRAGSGSGSAEVLALRRQLQAATAALERQQLAAGLDFRGIEARNGRAVAVLYVESAGGVVTTGTAFAVRRDATLLTSRHVLLDETGNPPRRIGIQFSGSEQVWPARLLAASAAADLAVIQADNILGDVPTVQGLNLRPDTIRPGVAVALMGFPLGGQQPMPGQTSGRIAMPLLSAGVVTRAGPERIEIQGYGAAGASGSPVFDARGEVIAILFGGRSESGERALLAVPASAARPLLDAVR